MAFSFKFANLLSAPFRGGSAFFVKDGKSLVAPAGNRISVTNLSGSQSLVLPYEAKADIRRMALSEDERLLIVGDAENNLFVVNFRSSSLMSRRRMRDRIGDISFSPKGDLLCVASGTEVFLFRVPTAASGWELTLVRICREHKGRVSQVDWSRDGRFFLSASDDTTCRLHPATLKPRAATIAFQMHKSVLSGAHLSSDALRIVTVAMNGIIDLTVFEPAEAKDESDDQKASPQRGRVRSWISSAPERRTKARLVESSVDQDDDSNSSEGDGFEYELDVKGEEGVDPPAKLSLISGSKYYYLSEGAWVRDLRGSCHPEDSKGRAPVMQTAFIDAAGLLAVGFASGRVSLYQVPSLDSLYTLMIGSSAIDVLSFSPDGEWLALASEGTGQLMVWEWRSETFVLKQQGHTFGVRCLDFSPTNTKTLATSKTSNTDGPLGLGVRHVMATGAFDGKVKLWDTQSGFCFVTFSNHTAAVTDLKFVPQGNAVISASLDGTVRAFDLMRYRNFQTFIAPEGKAQFECLAIDGGGELVAAACAGTSYSICVWRIQTGALLETLAGHDAAVSSLAFSPHPSEGGVLASGSWDSSVRIWDIYKSGRRGGAATPLVASSEVTALAFDTRGNQRLAVAHLGGSVVFWDTEVSEIVGSIEGLRDIQSGRMKHQVFSQGARDKIHKDEGRNATTYRNQAFNSIAYAANGNWILASSKFSCRVCIYDTERYVLIQAVRLTQNTSIEGVSMKPLYRYEKAALGDADTADLSDIETEPQEQIRAKTKKGKGQLPGASLGEFGSPHERFVCWMLRASVEGRQWGVATSHGLFLFEVGAKGGLVGGNESLVAAAHRDRFVPFLLTRNVSIPNILEALANAEYAKAVLLALALNDIRQLRVVFASVPLAGVSSCTRSVPPSLLPSLLNFLRILLSAKCSKCPHIQLLLWWLSCVLTTHLNSLQNWNPATATSTTQGAVMRGYSQSEIRSLLLMVLREVQVVQGYLGGLYGANVATMEYLVDRRKISAPRKRPWFD